MIERKRLGPAGTAAPKPEEALPAAARRARNSSPRARERRRGRRTGELGRRTSIPDFDWKAYGFQEFSEFLNYAQDKTRGAHRTGRRARPDRVSRRRVLSAGAARRRPSRRRAEEEEDEGPQPIVEGQPTIFEPNPPPPKPEAGKDAPASARPRKPPATASRSAAPAGRRRINDRATHTARVPRSPRARTRPRSAPAISSSFPDKAPIDPATDQFSYGDIKHETRMTLTNIQRILEGCGASMADVVKVLRVPAGRPRLRRHERGLHRVLRRRQARPHHGGSEIRQSADESRDRLHRV